MGDVLNNKDWLAELEELAIKAGELIITGFNSSKKTTEKSSAMDIVTEFDSKVEDLLREEIKNRYPEHLVLGEEQEYINKDFGSYLPAMGFVWIIDPIDGTLNFASGIPLFAVSIGLYYNGEPVAGVVYNPVIKEMFAAQKGCGATLNGQIIRIKESETLERSIIGVSIARRKGDSKLHKLADQVGGMRALGTAAIALAYVAAGRLDAYWEKDLRLWDVAAGAILIQEAGGCIKISNLSDEYPVKIEEIFAGGANIDQYIEITKSI